MKKNDYIQPSIEVTEIMTVQTICESPAGGGTPLGGGLDPEITTGEQL